MSSAAGSHDEDVKNLVHGPVDFSALASFDISSVRVRNVGIGGFLTVRQGDDPRSAAVGECCGDPTCRYRLLELTVFPSLDAVAARHLHDVLRRYPDIPATELLTGLLLDVYEVRGEEPISIADLRQHPILWRVPMSIDGLREHGSGELARGASDWELVRLLKDGLDVGGIELPAYSGERGRDFVIHRDHEDKLSFDRIGCFEEVAPAVGEQAERNGLARLLRRLMGGER